MTVRKAMDLAKKMIKQDLEYIEKIQQYDVEHPDISEEKLGYRITKVVSTIVLNEVMLLRQITDEIRPKPRKKSKK